MFWPRLASISMRGLGLVATQTLIFVFTECHQLIRAGLAVHGG